MNTGGRKYIKGIILHINSNNNKVTTLSPRTAGKTILEGLNQLYGTPCSVVIQ